MNGMGNVQMLTLSLNDPIDQRERFAAQDATGSSTVMRKHNHTDEDFLNALAVRYAANRWYRIRYRQNGYAAHRFTQQSGMFYCSRR